MTTMQAVEQQAATQREACENAQQRHEQALKAVRAAEDRLKALDKQIAALNAQLALIDRKVDAAYAAGRKADRWRKRRRELHTKLEDLERERPIAEKHVHVAETKAEEALVELHLARRRQLQEEGSAVASEIRKLLTRVGERFQRWKVLAEDDRFSKDVTRGRVTVPGANLSEFSWTTALDGNFQAAITAVVEEAQRAEGELKKRRLVGSHSSVREANASEVLEQLDRK